MRRTREDMPAPVTQSGSQVTASDQSTGESIYLKVCKERLSIARHSESS